VGPEEVVGVALVRVWAPFTAPDRLVIRIVAAGPGEPRPIGVASTIDDATAIVQSWLESLVRDPPASPSAPPSAGPESDDLQRPRRRLRRAGDEPGTA
jgi:hypothetical protein